MCNITKLNAKSESREIRRYFKTVLLLLRSGEKFPVNLDDVWPLVYGSRDDAVHFLTEVGLFYNGEDYKVFRRNAENLSGRHTSNRYMLSVSCMEYVIVRKSRRLLASFRYVFRKYIDISVLSEDEIIVKAMLIQQSRLEGSSRFLELNMKKIEAFRMQLEIEKEAIMERKREFLDEKNADLERAMKVSSQANTSRRYTGSCI